jgi:peroxiredoxin Q/BCP
VAKATTKGKTSGSTKIKAVARIKVRKSAKMGKAGAIAPDFRLRDGNGKIHRLANYQGQKVILYFYPKDDTPGCTFEAEDFNKNFKKIKAKGAIVLGVSPDNEVSHKRFSEKLELDFPLLADPDAEVASKYGAYGEKTLFGTKFNSVFRSTFIIDEEGKIQKVFQDVKVEGHTKEVLESL